MSGPSLEQLERRVTAACLQLDERRRGVIGAIPLLKEGLADLAEQQLLKRVESAATVPVLVVGALGGLWLLLRRPMRPRWWTMAAIGWRGWKLWTELRHSQLPMASRPAGQVGMRAS